MAGYRGQALMVVALLVASALPAAADTRLTIWFTNNTDGSIPAVCAAMVTTKKQPTKRNATVQWKLKNDGDNPCPSFDPTLVSIEFDQDVLVGGKKLKGKSGKPNHYAEDVVDDNAQTKDGAKQPYRIYYDGKSAGDPELDINGQQILSAKGKRILAAERPKKP